MSKRFRALILLMIFVLIAGWFLIFYMPDKAAEYIYQTDFEEYVEKYSDEFNVDPALVYAVIKVESNFNPSAVSDVGAIGLMQMIEDSFDWVAWKLGRDDLDYEDLYDPEYAVMFGSYMVGYLYDRYKSVELTAAAYHAGMGKVDEWIESGLVDPQNVDISDISGKNTAHYVSKILRAYEHYKKSE